MPWNLSLLIALPLIELFTARFERKNPKLHKLILVKIVFLCLTLSINLPISPQIYRLDLGFLTLKFMCDIYSYFFGILVITVWIPTLIYSASYSKINIKSHKINDFYKYLSLSIFAVLGNGYAGDLWTLFIFYNLLIIFTAPLIVHHVSKSSVKAFRLYLFTNIGTSILLFLPAIILLQHFGGNVDFAKNTDNILLKNHRLASLLLFLFTFGISKNCILPFHNWITKSTIAPNPVSALLHSVAAVKSGSIAIIKIIVYIFGMDLTRKLTSHFWSGGWVFYLCGITAIYAAYRALKTKDIKKRFAYSTISQLSYIVSSVMIATPLALMGVVLHIISHSLCKIILFYIAGIFSSLYQTRRTEDIAKIAPHLKFWIGCLAFCGASIIGVPLMPGAYGKDYMLISEFQTHHYASMVFLITGSLINILYIYPVIKAGFFTKTSSKIIIKKIPLGMRIAIIITMLLVMAMGIFIVDLSNFFKAYDV